MRTTNTLIVGLCKINDFEDALYILPSIAVRGYPVASAIYNTLIGGLCKVGQVKKAHILYNELLYQGHRPSNTISSILIDGLLKLRTDNIELACETVNGITKNGFTLVAANLNALINTLCKAGRVKHARKYLMEMKKPYIGCYITFIGGFCMLGMVDEAVNQLEKISRKGLTHRAIYALYSSLIKACYKSKKVEVAAQILNQMLRERVVPSSSSCIYVMHHLGKVGKTFEASKVREEMIECRFSVNVRLYSEVMSSLFQAGEEGKTLQLQDKIIRRGCGTDFLTYGLSIKQLCSKGKVDEASKLLDDINQRYPIPGITL